MTAGHDLSSGTFQGSVFAGCTFAASPPPWVFEAGRLVEATSLFAQMPDGEVPPLGGLPPGSWMPHAPNPNFVGREGELRAVAAALRGAGAAALCPPVGLQGLGGAGKTQLAVEFASRYGRWFAGGVFWLECAEPASIDAQVARLGAEAALEAPERFAAMPLAEQCATVWRLWRSGMPRLLVFDNCEDDALLGALRPKQGGCRVLVTSRRSEWSVAHGLRPVRVPALPRAESVVLLAGFRPDLAGRAELGAIAEELGDLPLALHLAGSFLRENRFDGDGEPTEYLANLRAEGLDHASLVGALGASGVVDALPTEHDRNVARTFALSWDRLDPAVPVDATARQAMACAAWFAPRVPIPRDLLAPAVRVLAGDEVARVGAALMRLLALGLVAEEPGGDVSLHRLVAVFAAARAGDPAEARDACGAALRGALSEANRTGLPARCAPLLPHATWFLSAAEIDLAPDLKAQVLNELGFAENMRGAHGAARARFGRALAVWEAALGPDHPDVARGHNNLALVLRAQGDLAGAGERFRRALAVWEAALGPDHPDVARGHNNLAGVLHAQGDLAGAGERFRRALAILTRALGLEHPSTRMVRDNLAALSPPENLGSPLAQLVGSSEGAFALSRASAGSQAPAADRAPGEISCLAASEAPLARPMPQSEETLMVETPFGGPKYNFGGATIHGSVFNDAVFHEAVSLTHGLGAQPSQQADLAKALETLRAQLAAVPDDKRPLADKAAESAKDVAAAAKPGGDESLFRGAVRSLRGWAEDIAKTVPAVTGAAEQVVKLAGQVRGWIPPGLG